MTPDTYTASDGSLWHVENICPPVPSREYDWEAVHDDYGGSGDDRHVYAASRAGVIAAVEQFIEEDQS